MIASRNESSVVDVPNRLVRYLQRVGRGFAIRRQILNEYYGMKKALVFRRCVVLRKAIESIKGWRDRAERQMHLTKNIQQIYLHETNMRQAIYRAALQLFETVHQIEFDPMRKSIEATDHQRRRHLQHMAALLRRESIVRIEIVHDETNAIMQLQRRERQQLLILRNHETKQKQVIFARIQQEKMQVAQQKAEQREQEIRKEREIERMKIRSYTTLSLPPIRHQLSVISAPNNPIVADAGKIRSKKPRPPAAPKKSRSTVEKKSPRPRVPQAPLNVLSLAAQAALARCFGTAM